MQFTLPSYSGNRDFKASRLSPWINLFPSFFSWFCTQFSALKPYLWSKIRNGTSRWWFTTLSFPIQFSDGIYYFSLFLISLNQLSISLKAFLCFKMSTVIKLAVIEFKCFLTKSKHFFYTYFLEFPNFGVDF